MCIRWLHRKQPYTIQHMHIYITENHMIYIQITSNKTYKEINLEGGNKKKLVILKI